MIGLEQQRPVVIRQGLLVASCLGQQCAQIVADLGVGRIGRARGLVSGQGFVKSPKRLQDEGAIGERRRVTGVGRKRRLEARQRLFESGELNEGDAAPDQRSRVPGPQRQCMPIPLERLGMPA